MKTLFLVSLVLFGCSRINTDSRDYYQQRGGVQHGLVTVAPPLKAPPKAEHDNSVARGKQLYEAHCLHCHGPQGEGDGVDAPAQKHPPANLKNTVRKVSHFDFYLSISQYERKMPGWSREFSADERRDIVSYLKTFR